MILAVFNTIVFIAIACINISGFIDYGPDFNLYNHSEKGWTAAFFNFSAMGIVMILTTGRGLKVSCLFIIAEKTDEYIDISSSSADKALYRAED